jgi:hypothetical protein
VPTTSVPTAHQPSRRRHHRSDAQLWSSSHARTLRAAPPSAQQVHSGVSLRRAVDAVQRCGVSCSSRPSGFGSGTTGKQPANLAVEGAEESLSILPDCTPTVRPPPKRC